MLDATISHTHLKHCYQICRRYDIELLRYGYNEPCKGKDQCDQESAAAKTIITRSYVDAGNDLMNAEDIYNTLHYGFGMQDAMVCVAEVDTSATTLIGPKVPSFTSYYSVSFTYKVWDCGIFFGLKKVYFNISSSAISTRHQNHQRF